MIPGPLRRAAFALAALTLAGAFGTSVALAASAPSLAARAPSLLWVHCRPAAKIACDRSHPARLVRGALAEAGGSGMTPRTRLVFPVRGVNGAGRRAVSGRLVRPTRLDATVPSDAVSGSVWLLSPSGRRSGALRVRIAHPRPASGGSGVAAASVTTASAAFDSAGMWVWYLEKSAGGDPAAIGAQAATAGLHTVYLKAGDGTGQWAQFSAANVSALKAQNLHVCAWVYVYGLKPVDEAAVAVAAARNGAECLVIDAEGEYEGRYAQAQQYLQAVRSVLGAAYPIGLASFPYVDYHPKFPFSVFLGPGGAQFNLPQMYWKDIGTTPDGAYAHTWPVNRVYGSSILPLGQLYNAPAASDVTRFRQLAALYAAQGLSWWDWQEATQSQFDTLGAPLASTGETAPAAASAWPALGRGAKGDLVVWAQEHLASAGQTVTLDGQYGAQTESAVSAFQQARGLEVTGRIDDPTWPALLGVVPQAPDWVSSGAPASAG